MGGWIVRVVDKYGWLDRYRWMDKQIDRASFLEQLLQSRTPSYGTSPKQFFCNHTHHIHNVYKSSSHSPFLINLRSHQMTNYSQTTFTVILLYTLLETRHTHIHLHSPHIPLPNNNSHCTTFTILTNQYRAHIHEKHYQP